MRDAIARAGGLKRLHRSADAVLAEALEAEGWTYTPPKPVLPVVSDAAVNANEGAIAAMGQHWSRRPKEQVAEGLRAAFKVMLRENLERAGMHRNQHGGISVWPDTFYRLLTGEDWPA